MKQWHKCESTFMDFSQRPEPEWLKQAEEYPNVFVYYDPNQKCYCRKITGVKGIRIGNKFKPIGHPLVKYWQLNLEPCVH